MGALALDFMESTALHPHLFGITKAGNDAALADLRALMAERDRLRAELESVTVTLDGWKDGARIAALSAEQRGDDAEQVAQSNIHDNYGKLVSIARAALAECGGGK